MSQVIVEKDKHSARRLKSGDQEQRIDREGGFAKWKRNDITGFDPIAAGAGLAAAPVVALFWIMSWTVKIALFGAAVIGKVVGLVVGKSKKASI